jgi:hypothetical protein
MMKLMTGYIAIDASKMEMQAKRNYASKKIENPEDLSFGDFIESIGLCDSTFNNARHNYNRPARNGRSNKEIVDSLYNTENVVGIGIIRKAAYMHLINMFNLSDIYQLKEKTEEQEEVKPELPTNNKDDVIAKLDEILVAINRLGNLEMQILEKMNKDNRPRAFISQSKEDR